MSEPLPPPGWYGPTLATRIRGAAQTLWQTTYDEMPARIDIKNRTAEATQLLRRLQVWDAVRKNIGGTADLDLAQELARSPEVIDGDSDAGGRATVHGSARMWRNSATRSTPLCSPPG